jgi:hypothetical protein
VWSFFPISGLEKQQPFLKLQIVSFLDVASGSAIQQSQSPLIPVCAELTETIPAKKRKLQDHVDSNSGSYEAKVLALEREKLSVLRQLLEVEKERLEIERQRLTIETQRHQIYQAKYGVTFTTE